MWHLVGPPVVIGDRLIQRCLVCGMKLQDSNDEDCTRWNPESGSMKTRMSSKQRPTYRLITVWSLWNDNLSNGYVLR